MKFAPVALAAILLLASCGKPEPERVTVRSDTSLAAVTTSPPPSMTTTAAPAPPRPAPCTGYPPMPAKSYARLYIECSRGWGLEQFRCLDVLWERESSWLVTAGRRGVRGSYGIPQAYPGTKMAEAGPDWQTNPRPQIRWGTGYIATRYGTPCAALARWNARRPHWY